MNLEKSANMPVMGPHENTKQVEECYNIVMKYLQRKYKIQTFPILYREQFYLKEREHRNANLKEAIRKLFELESWEGF